MDKMSTKEDTKRKNRKFGKKDKQLKAKAERQQEKAINQQNEQNEQNEKKKKEEKKEKERTIPAQVERTREDDDSGDDNVFEVKKTCRMYEEVMPEAGDLVVIQVKEFIDAGAYVSLLEYNGISGLILMEEASRVRARSISQVLRLESQEVAVVIRTDPKRGYIDLSRRRVSSEEKEQCLDKFYRSKVVHDILGSVSRKCHTPLLGLYETFGWDLYRRFGHAYNAFCQHLEQESPAVLFATAVAELQKEEKEKQEKQEKKEEARDQVLGKYGLAPEMRQVLQKEMQRHIVMRTIKVRAECNLECFYHPDGIEAIKAAIRAGLVHSTPHTPLTIKVVVSPKYAIEISCSEVTLGKTIIGWVIESMRRSLESKLGRCTVVTPPCVVNRQDAERPYEKLQDLLDNPVESLWDVDE